MFLIEKTFLVYMYFYFYDYVHVTLSQRNVNIIFFGCDFGVFWDFFHRKIMRIDIF